MESNRKFLYVLNKQEAKKPPKLLFLSNNLMREIISYLTFVEFKTFCFSSKEFYKFLTDKFVRIHEKAATTSGSESFYPVDKSLLVYQLESALRYKLLHCNMFYKPYIKLRALQPLVPFHFTSDGAQKLIFFYSENYILVKECNRWNTEMLSKEILECPGHVKLAKAYKNRIVASTPENLVMFVLGFDYATCQNYSVKVLPFKNRSISKIRFYNSGENFLLQSESAVFVMSKHLSILKCIRIEEGIKGIHVPEVDSNVFLVYHGNSINFYRGNSAKPFKSIQTKEKVFKVTTGKAQNNEKTEKFLTYISDYQRVYLNNKDKYALMLYSFEYKLVDKYLICLDNLNSELRFYDLTTTEIVYGLYLGSQEVKILHVSAYKGIFQSPYEIYILYFGEPFTRKRVNHFFEADVKAKYIRPFLILYGKQKNKNSYGSMALNVYDLIPKAEYLEIAS